MLKFKYEINEKLLEYKDFLLNISKNFEQEQSYIHKARNEVKKIKYNEENFIVKSFKIPNILRRVYYTFLSNSKAKKSYKNSLILKELTPEPLGYIEFYKYNLLNKSYFISKNYEYDFTIREPLLDKNFKKRDLILREFAKFSANLHRKDILHKDYSPGNILIKEFEDRYEFNLVDINRMKFMKIDEKTALHSFKKLWANDEDLTVILNEYAINLGINQNSFIKEGLKISNRYKNFKIFFKKIRGKK